MKVTKIICDLCNGEVEEEESPFVIGGAKRATKQVGCDISLTPRGDRLNVEARTLRTKNAVVRLNASFYCGTLEPGEELHFHRRCIDWEVRQRIKEYLK